MKKTFLLVTKYITLLFAMLLLSSCAMTPIILDAKYERMPSAPVGGERVIGRVVLEGEVQTRSSGSGYSQVPQPRKMGETYNVLESKKGPPRHRDETRLEQLFSMAQQMYPNEAIDLRNATTRYRHIRNYVESGVVQTKEGNKTVTTYYTVFQPVYVADVVTAEPMPRPPSHSVEIPLIGTRADIFRKAQNWLDDVKGEYVKMEIKDHDRGRLKGEYVIGIEHGQFYIIISTFTIDIYDERAEIKFDNPRLQRVNSSHVEPIFLQSIANRVQTEMGVFCEELKRATLPQ